MPSTLRVVCAAPPPKPTQHAGRAGAHQVQGRGVRGAAADDHRDVQLVDELLEVQRLGGAGDVLGGDRRTADDEDVHARVDDGLGELGGALRGERGGGDHTRVAHLLDALPDQLLPDRRGVDLLEAAGRRRPRPARRSRRAAAAGPRTGSTGLRGSARRGRPARRCGSRSAGETTESMGAARNGQLEAVGVDLPGDRDLLRVAGTTARDDGDVVERVRPAAALAAPDLDLSHVCGLSLFGLRRPVSPTRTTERGPGTAGTAPRTSRCTARALSLPAVVRRLDRHLDVVRVALLETRRR